MRVLPSRRRIVIGAAVLLFVLSLNFVAGGTRSISSSLSSSWQAVFWQAGDNISNFFEGGNLQRELERFREENFSLQSEVRELQDLREENEKLRRALGIQAERNFQLVLGEVIGKNIGEDVLRIRAGKEEGIQPGMPVITSSRIVVGRVREVFSNVSTIRLLSHKESKFDGKIPGRQITGIVRGQGRQKALFDLVPHEEQLEIGDSVVTSNLGGIFPENLLVGEVTDVIKTGADPFQKAHVNPFFHIESAETVFVIVNFL